MLIRAIITEIVEVNDREQVLRCRECREEKEIPRRVWHREDLRLDAIEEFKEVHELCAEKRLKAYKIRFFCRPFRPKRAKQTVSLPARKSAARGISP
jgi:hypothetical protein